MNVTKFYELCDKTEEITDNVTGGYFPTVEELQRMITGKSIEKYIYIISYFASNPFKRQNNKFANLKDYEDTVRFCKEYMTKIELD